MISLNLLKMCCDPAVHLYQASLRKRTKQARSHIYTYHCLDAQNSQTDNYQLADQPIDPPTLAASAGT